MLYLTFLTQSAKERGAGLAEYALLLALIAVIAIPGVTLLGGNILVIFNNIAAAL